MELHPAGLLFLLVSLPIALTDLWRQQIPDMLSLGGLALAFSLLAFSSPAELPGRVAAAALAFGCFYLLRAACSNRLGLGDVKYAAFMGATLGTDGWFVAVLGGSLLALLLAAILIVFGGMQPRDRIPFAPFLAAGGALWLFAGEPLVELLARGDLP